VINLIELKQNSMRIFGLKQEGLFTNRMISNLLFPILIEQIMIVAIGIADIMMIAHVSETAVAGISFITTFDNLIKKLISALAIGGSIVISQYIGKNELKSANKAMKMAFYSIFSFASFACLILFIFQKPFLTLLTGNIEADVMRNAKTYFSLSLFSYPFFAAYYVASASFRAMCKSKISMISLLIMMAMNLILKAILIYVFKLGVFGAGVSTLFSVVFVGTVMTVMMCMPLNPVHIEKFFYIKFDFTMIKRIFKIGIPNSIENGMFQFGLLILQRLTASFGTASIAANAIVKSVSPISFTVAGSYALAIVTIVGQCMGAGKTDQAVIYTKHILKTNYIIALFINLGCIVYNHQLIGMFNLSQEASSLASSVFYVYCIGAIFFYPTSFVLPNALRASGDTKFTMTASMATMFGARIGMAFVLGKYMNMGLFGVWLAMQLDWAIRSVLFIFRFKKGKWKEIKVI